MHEMLLPVALPHPMSYTELSAMPENGHRYDLIGGLLYVKAFPNKAHQTASMRLACQLFGHVAPRGLGEVYAAPFPVRLTGYDAVQPDLFFVRAERLPIVGERFVDGPPDLTVEILSSESRDQDRGRKLALYASRGVGEYWVVDPLGRTLTVFTPVQGRYEILTAPGQPVKSKILPDINVDLDALFADL